MGPMTVPSSMAELDASFVFDGAYRSRGSMTMAERASYGLGEARSSFAAHIPLRAHSPCSPQTSIGAVEHPQNESVVSSLPPRRVQGSRRVVIPSGGSTPAATHQRRPSAASHPRRCPRAGLRRDTPIRFTVKLNDRVLEGVALAGRIIATRELPGRAR